MNGNLTPIRILVIDDDLEGCNILKRTFELTDDMELCGTASSGESGIEMAKKLKPDVILLDIVVPSVDGIDVAKKIRQINMDKQPRIIIFTAIGNQNIIKDAFDAGVDYYLRKPFNLMSLVDKVRMVYKNKEYTGAYNAYKPKSKIIKDVVKGLGTPINITGYKYILQTLEIMFDNSMTFKEMYDMVACKNNTSSQCVEISIRNAIKKTFELRNDFYLNVFEEYKDKAPSNSVFLETVKEIVDSKTLE